MHTISIRCHTKESSISILKRPFIIKTLQKLLNNFGMFGSKERELIGMILSGYPPFLVT